MKKVLFPILALVSVFILWGCPEPEQPTEDDVLEAIKTEYTIGAEASEFTVSFKTNVDYTVKSSDESWLTVTVPSRAVKTETVTVKAKANTSTSPREANIKITAGTQNATIVVKQEGLTPSIVINGNTSRTVSEDGATITVEIESNVEYTVDIDVAWITRGSSALGAETFVVEANPAEESRTGHITFKYGDISKMVTVSQNAKQPEAPTPFIDVDILRFDQPAEASTIEMTVTSNVEYQTVISHDWVTPLGGGKFSVAENTSTEARTATITFKYGDLSKTVTVNQAGKSDTPVEDDVLANNGASTYSVGWEGGSIEVLVRTNVDYTVDCPVTWINKVTSRTVREDKVMFVVDANSTSETRSATITFSFGETLSFAVTVAQEAYVPPVEEPFFEITPPEATIGAEGGKVEFVVNTNVEYFVDIPESWVTADSQSATALSLNVAANTNTVSRNMMITITGDGIVPVFVSVTQEPGEEIDPFDVGSDLSKNGTANCYLVTKAGTFSFSVQYMGNGPDGFIWSDSEAETQLLWPSKKANVSLYATSEKPNSASVLWDDNNVVTNVTYNSSNKTISFDATGNKGNALITLIGKYGTLLWSWHIWCTDSPKHMTQYDELDRSYVLLDRNIGATSADPADGEATYGYFYQFGRKDPLRAYYGCAKDMHECEAELVNSVRHPDWIYLMGTKTCEWFNTGIGLPRVTADLWGNPFMRHCSVDYGVPSDHPNPARRDELKKTIYDPCPPGYMVPPEDTWAGYTDRDIQIIDNGVIIPTASGDSFYPFAGFIADMNTDEKPHPERFGYYAYNGYERQASRSIFREACVYTSCTGLNSMWQDIDIHPNYFGGRYMSVYFNYSQAPDELRFNPKHYHVRQCGRPVRCMKVFGPDDL